VITSWNSFNLDKAESPFPNNLPNDYSLLAMKYILSSYVVANDKRDIVPKENIGTRA
jgi:hypothetical protein